jgi:acylphosphatase
MQSYRFIISGKVQKVGYRQAIAEAVAPLGLTGFIRNLDNGTVEACTTLDDTTYHLFVSFLKRGSSLSETTSVESFIVNEQFDTVFEIRN